MSSIQRPWPWGPLLIVAACCLGASVSRADQVQMLNGDLYAGRVVSLDATNLVLQSDELGTLKLPRAKVDSIRFTPAPGAVPSAKPTATDKSTNAALVLPRLDATNANTHASAEQLLEGATPEARAKFNSMVSGLLTGKLNAQDIRVEARSIAEQVRAMKADLGEDAGGMLDSYLAILDRFIAEEDTRTAKPPAKPAPAP